MPDVRAVGNYIACNTYTRSELVVLIRRGTLVLGQIDVDSDVPNPFTLCPPSATALTISATVSTAVPGTIFPLSTRGRRSQLTLSASCFFAAPSALQISSPLTSGLPP